LYWTKKINEKISKNSQSIGVYQIKMAVFGIRNIVFALFLGEGGRRAVIDNFSSLFHFAPRLAEKYFRAE